MERVRTTTKTWQKILMETLGRVTVPKHLGLARFTRVKRGICPRTVTSSASHGRCASAAQPTSPRAEQAAVSKRRGRSDHGTGHELENAGGTTGGTTRATPPAAARRSPGTRSTAGTEPGSRPPVFNQLGQ